MAWLGIVRFPSPLQDINLHGTYKHPEASSSKAYRVFYCLLSPPSGARKSLERRPGQARRWGLRKVAKSSRLACCMAWTAARSVCAQACAWRNAKVLPSLNVTKPWAFSRVIVGSLRNIALGGAKNTVQTASHSTSRSLTGSMAPYSSLLFGDKLISECFVSVLCALLVNA
jgi:hypothetical protein